MCGVKCTQLVEQKRAFQLKTKPLRCVEPVIAAEGAMLYWY